ncbi:hypothetical protein M9458_026223, partial [Cirrhinus mrigala]
WSKNDQEVEPSDHYVVAMDSGKFASLTIKGVSLEDSGKYTMTVQNKYGGDVYKHGDRIPEIKPTPTPKRIMPPTVPIVIPTAMSATPAPAAAKSPPQNAKTAAPPRGM